MIIWLKFSLILSDLCFMANLFVICMGSLSCSTTEIHFFFISIKEQPYFKVYCLLQFLLFLSALSMLEMYLYYKKKKLNFIVHRMTGFLLFMIGLSWWIYIPFLITWLTCLNAYLYFVRMDWPLRLRSQGSKWRKGRTEQRKSEVWRRYSLRLIHVFKFFFFNVLDNL